MSPSPARDNTARDHAARDRTARDRAARDHAARDRTARDQGAPRLLAPLARRIASARSEAAVPRDPDLIRRQLPAIARYTSYFTPEVRGVERLPADGPVLVVGNHSCLFYMPEVWICGQAVAGRRGVSRPAYLLTYDLLFAVPKVGPFLRRLGAIPASNTDAESALRAGACVTVYPGGDREACRPWTDRNRIDFSGRTGFVRLALRCGVPVVPVVAHGGQHAVIVLNRGDRLARATGLHSLRIKVLPFLAGPPFGLNSILTPPPPMPAQLTLEFLPPLDWTGLGPDAAEDDEVVSACYADITGRMQAALDRLAADRPYPLLAGFSKLTERTAAGTMRGRRYDAPGRRTRPGPGPPASPRGSVSRGPARGLRPAGDRQTV